MDEQIQAEINSFRTKIDSASLPSSLREILNRLLSELERSAGGTNYFETSERIRHYIDWVIKIPWNNQAVDRLDLTQAKTILDQHHYGLEDVKTRLLEYLAVLKLGQDRNQTVGLRAPVLLLVGLAGTGKTTFAKAIAEAMGRPFVRIPFGGLGSARDLRGQSRLHLEAEPGQVVKALIRAQVANPVILLDEIDRVSKENLSDVMGVLVELLDPEQNQAYVDHYIDFPVDLSQVLFIATCNNTTNIATAVMDRMEPMTMPSYTDTEKMMIAKNYLLPKALTEANLDAHSVTIEDVVWPQIIRPLGYDSGIRTLQRTIQGIVRKVAKHTVEQGSQQIIINAGNVNDFLPTYRTELL
jgi:ATP-dependent Lon protease